MGKSVNKIPKIPALQGVYILVDGDRELKYKSEEPIVYEKIATEKN